ncbi:MAG TPA: divergent polysaccharide deacetylase family protein [Thermohalobaculum sp.]|nr:divergent polysaccharide deacetylase family protein [Thermohalobaculum sp.]
MRRRFDDEDERPSWVWRLVKGVLAGAIVSGLAVAALSLVVLPPPAPPPPPAQSAGAEADGSPAVIDGIEVATRPAYFGAATTDSEPATGDAAGPIELSGAALVVNAAPFEAAPAAPLVAVVLDDAAANPLLHETLFAIDMPLTIGVVAGSGGDRVTAEAARAAGFEVVAQLPLAEPGAAEGAALEYGLPAEEAAERTLLLLRRLPMAVAATRPLAAPAPPNASVLEGMLDALGPLGFAYLDHGVAPGTASAVVSDGLERIVGVSRFTIPAGASAAEAHATLDRAAAEAAQSGAAVVVAAVDEQVLLALQLWGGEGVVSAEGAVDVAQLAPLSAVIRRQNGGDLPQEEAATEAAATGGAAN